LLNENVIEKPTYMESIVMDHVENIGIEEIVEIISEFNTVKKW
jgi:hypothetical protein